jgi:hypothetical protein
MTVINAALNTRVRKLEDIILYNKKADATGNIVAVVEDIYKEKDKNEISRTNNRTVFDEILDKLLDTETIFK